MSDKLPEIEGPKGQTPQNINFWTSPNAIPLIVGLMFGLVFIGYIFVLIFRPELNKEIGSHIWSILTLLIGFYSGTATANKKR